MLFLISLLVFIVTAAIMLIAYKTFMADKQALSQRLNRYTRLQSVPIELKAHVPAENKQNFRQLLRNASKYVEIPRLTRWFEHRLMQAGLPIRGSEFLVVCSGAAIGAAVVLGLLAGSIAAMAIGASLGFMAPIIALRIKIDRRTVAFNNQLGDSLVLIANSLRTGYSFMQAIEMVSREMPEPISSEFGRVLKEMNLGITTEEAMNNLAKRINSDDLDLVITAVLIQRQVGGNLAEVLDNIATTIRDRVKLKGKVKTLTAQGRISGMIVGLLPICVGVLIYLINPEYIKVLFIHPMGRVMLAAGIISQLLGIIVIRKIVNIEV